MHGGTDCTARAARRTEPPVRSYGDCEVSGNRSSQTIAWLGRVGRVGIGPKKDGAYGGRTRMDQVGCSILCVLFSSFLHDGSIAFNCMFVFSLNCRPQIFGQGTSTIAMEELSMAFSIAGWYAAGFLCRCSWGGHSHHSHINTSTSTREPKSPQALIFSNRTTSHAMVSEFSEQNIGIPCC